MRKLFMCCGWLVSITIALAQPAIEKDYNLLRVEDYLYKQQVEFINPGTSGEDQFWDFSDLKVIDEKYKVSHMEYPDSLLITRELRNLYKYALKGDTLISTGMENTTTLLEYSYPQLQLIFPVNYTDKYEDYFYGEGHYCRQIKLTVDGFCSYHADAWGKIVIPEGDTLTNVLRIKHTVRQVEQQSVYDPYFPADSITPIIRSDSSLANDSLWTETDTYSWYAEGYRYPVFESIQHYKHHRGNKELQASTSFYYSPDEQYYGLEDDPENREQRERIMWERKVTADRRKTHGQQESALEKDQGEFSYFLHHDREQEVITLNYKVVTPTQVSLLLTDVQGRVLVQISPSLKETGSYMEEFPLTNFLKQEYLVRIITDENTYTEKIIN